MTDVIAIADAILKIAKSNNKSLTPLQLMKLVYIAHGWSLVLRRAPLFDDRIEAWKYGPVIPDLYQATKGYGRSPIPLDVIDDAPPAVEADVQEFLEEVFRQYGNLSGYSLSSLTHKRGSPWQQVYEEGCLGIEIPSNLIKEHYEILLHDSSSNSTTSSGRQAMSNVGG